MHATNHHRFFLHHFVKRIHLFCCYPRYNGAKVTSDPDSFLKRPLRCKFNIITVNLRHAILLKDRCLWKGQWPTAPSSWVRETDSSFLFRALGSRVETRETPRSRRCHRRYHRHRRGLLSLNSSPPLCCAPTVVTPLFSRLDISSCLFLLSLSLFIFHRQKGITSNLTCFHIFFCSHALMVQWEFVRSERGEWEEVCGGGGG